MFKIDRFIMTSIVIPLDLGSKRPMLSSWATLMQVPPTFMPPTGRLIGLKLIPIITGDIFLLYNQ